MPAKMKGCSGRSWQDFGQVDAGTRRSAAWIDLLGAPPGVPACNFEKLSMSTTPSVNMFVDSLSKPSSSHYGACGHRKILETSGVPYGSPLSSPSECNRRAALDFVLELAGPRTVTSSGGKVLCSDAFVCGDEVPVPMFAVDRDMHCTMWNRRMEELNKWSEGEVMAMQKFPSCIFQPHSGQSQKCCEDVLKSALFGRDVSGAEFQVKTKEGVAKKALLYASARTDAGGALLGVLCVVIPVPQQSPRASQLEEGGGRDGAADRGEDTKDMFERSSSAVEAAAGSSGSGASRPRALVVDVFSARRNSLAIQLERCGMEVTCASSAQEAAWRFGHSLTDEEEGPPYSLVFVDLQVVSMDGYAAVRDIRKMESVLKPAGEVTSQTLILAVTSMDRWNLAAMDKSMDKSMSAGVDAVIPQNIKMQQLRSTLRKLGIRSKYLDVPATLPRALSGQFHNPLNLSR